MATRCEIHHTILRQHEQGSARAYDYKWSGQGSRSRGNGRKGPNEVAPEQALQASLLLVLPTPVGARPVDVDGGGPGRSLILRLDNKRSVCAYGVPRRLPG